MSAAPAQVGAFDLILPFLRPVESILLDETVSELMVNANGTVFAERDGVMEIQNVSITEESLQVAVKNIAVLLESEISPESPVLESRLPDGSRVAAVLRGVSVGGTTLTIRKFQHHRHSLEQLVQIGTIHAEHVASVSMAIEARQNILISGGVGTGKTTLLNALCALMPPQERIVLIEDTAEIAIPHRNLVRFEARRESPGMPAVTIRDLVKAALRHRPDRIIIGEVRGAEAFDLLDALNTGHSGSVSTIHAGSCELALDRLANCALRAGTGLPHNDMCAQIGGSIDMLVHLARQPNGKRMVTQVLRLRSYDRSAGGYKYEA